MHPWNAVVALWSSFKRRLGTVQAPSSSSVIDESAESHVVEMPDGPVQNDDDVVDEVIVDRVWSEDFTSSATHSDHIGSPEKSGGSHHGGRSASDHESLHGPEGVGGVLSVGVLLRWRIWPAIVKFFSSSFADPKSEANYAQVRRSLLEALQAIALFGLKLHRLPAAIGAGTFFVM
ncbi:hypothetical protein C0995_014950 [Termitomyces sp. Mi166|nr:hypothetical protein C0995_014950 [Termitomyces sp. Mi166\